MYVIYPVTLKPTSSIRRFIVEFLLYTFRHNRQTQTHTHTTGDKEFDSHNSTHINRHTFKQSLLRKAIGP